jgi:hypothetical protein
VDIGLTINFVGAADGVSVIAHDVDTPPALAVMVATVVSSTALVCIENPEPWKPAAIVTLAGTVTAAELLERLTTNPDGPASPPPSRLTQPDIGAPPVARTSGCRNSLSSVGGRSVIWLVAVAPLSVIESVMSVGDVTCPKKIGTSAHA